MAHIRQVEIESIYSQVFLPDIRALKYAVPNSTFSNNEILDCLEQETGSVRTITDILQNISPLRSILIIGTGSGKLGSYIRKKLATVQITEIDINKDVILRLETKHRNDPNRTPIHASGDALPFAGQTFDVVVGYSVFRYIRQPEASIKECIRVLKQGGQFILAEAKDKETIDTATKILGQLNIPNTLQITPNILLPRLTFFYYLLDHSTTNTRIGKLLDEEIAASHCSKTIAAFTIAGQTKGSIYSVVCPKP